MTDFSRDTTEIGTDSDYEVEDLHLEEDMDYDEEDSRSVSDQYSSTSDCYPVTMSKSSDLGPGPKKTDLSEKDSAKIRSLLIGKLAMINEKIEAAKSEYKKREDEISLFRDELLKLHGSYKTLLELGISMGYIDVDDKLKNDYNLFA